MRGRRVSTSHILSSELIGITFFRERELLIRLVEVASEFLAELCFGRELGFTEQFLGVVERGPAGIDRYLHRVRGFGCIECITDTIEPCRVATLGALEEILVFRGERPDVADVEIHRALLLVARDDHQGDDGREDECDDDHRGNREVVLMDHDE